jgi:hypothetical protein
MAPSKYLFACKLSRVVPPSPSLARPQLEAKFNFHLMVSFYTDRPTSWLFIVFA